VQRSGEVIFDVEDEIPGDEFVNDLEVQKAIEEFHNTMNKQRLKHDNELAALFNPVTIDIAPQQTLDELTKKLSDTSVAEDKSKGRPTLFSVPKRQAEHPAVDSELASNPEDRRTASPATKRSRQ
jgi:hypothetical protein